MTTPLKQIVQINDIVATSTTPIDSKSFFDMMPDTITIEVEVITKMAIDNKLVEPSMALVYSLPKYNSEEYLVAVAYSIRNMLSTDVYVDVPELGKVHILCYCYYILKDSYLEFVVTLLMMQNATPSLSYTDNQNDISVADWVYQNGYDTTLIDPKYIDNISDTTLLELFIMLDDSTKIQTLTIDSNNLLLCIKYSSDACFQLFIDDIMTNTEVDTKETVSIIDQAFQNAVYFLNDTAFDTLITYGGIPNQNLVDTMTDRMDKYNNINMTIPYNKLLNMMKRFVSSGIIVRGNLTGELQKAYNKPYWMKTCSVHDKIPNETLKTLASMLGLTYIDKLDLCQQLTSITKGNKNDMLEGYRIRQQNKIASNLGNVRQFINNVPKIDIKNASVLPMNPYDYNDNNIVFYRDNTDSIWAIPREQFAEFLKLGNVYTNQPLPISVVDEIKQKQSITTPPLNFPDILNELYPAQDDIKDDSIIS